MDRPPLIVPTLYEGPFILRPWRLTDLAVVREAGTDPYVPLVTTVPAASAGYDDERRDMRLYALLPTDPREATASPLTAAAPREDRRQR
ncbi:hypothetical protein [Kitasatospora sp. NPDC088264]|uniref:hypothetical protein n=2 Tax=Kitasatospora TaxID=2063 RepID=UPI00342F5626